MMLLRLLLQSVMSWPTKKICMIFCYSRSVDVELIFLLHPFLCFPHPRSRGSLCKLFFSFSAEFVKTLNPFFAIQGRHRIRKTFFLSSSLCSSVNYFGGCFILSIFISHHQSGAAAKTAVEWSAKSRRRSSCYFSLSFFSFLANPTSLICFSKLPIPSNNSHIGYLR